MFWKKRGGWGAAGVLACCVCCCVVVSRIPLLFVCPKRHAMAPFSLGDDGSRAPALLTILTVFSDGRLLRVHWVAVLMSILGEVRIAGLRCLQQFPQDKGLTKVIDIECRLSGNGFNQGRDWRSSLQWSQRQSFQRPTTWPHVGSGVLSRCPVG